MRTLTGKLTDIERFDTSRNGNPRHTASIGGVRCFTGVDSSLGYSITNHEGKRITAHARIVRGKLTIEGGVTVMPAHPDARYFAGQLEALELDRATENLCLKIRGTHGQTNYLKVSPEKVRAIFKILEEV